MVSRRKYTERVTDTGEGIFLWRHSIDREYELEKVKSGFRACLLVDFFILAAGALYTVLRNSPAFFIIAGICAAIFLLLSIVIFGITALLIDNPGEIYTMTDTFMQTGTGNSTVTFDYKKAKKVIVTTRYVEMKSAAKSMRVYASHEDISFVRNYILRRTGDAEVIYEVGNC